MFRQTVDDEINIFSVGEQFTARYDELARENYDYLSEWLEWPRYCKTRAGFSEFVKGSMDKYSAGKAMNCAVEYKGEIVGNCGFNIIDHNLKMAEIGYWIGQKYQGFGIVTRVCRFLISYAFNELGLEKVQIAAAENNFPSRAVCERLGMCLEGIITNREKVGERILNHAIYGIHKQNYKQ